MTPKRSKFEMLTKEAHRELLRYENTVIGLMVLVAIFSIIWSLSLHILSEDFNNGIISAKLVFRERDFSLLNNKSKEIFENDLANIINESYAENEIPITAPVEPVNNETDELESQTKAPKVRKISHVFAKTSKTTEMPIFEDEISIPTKEPKIIFNREADMKFLKSMSLDIHQTRWSYGTRAQFIYTFPLISEIVAVIWTAMCLIFQTSTKKAWGLPKPWRIVIPSIVIFTLMFIGNLAYTITMNSYLKRFCGDLRAPLSNPQAISCGDAMSMLRPILRQHSVSHDTYLNLFRASYILCLIFWLLALLIMLLRYIFAVDFQLVDVNDIFDRHSTAPSTIPKIYTEVKLRSPQHQTQLTQKNERPKSEDDFQSAQSHLSELATPLLEHQTEQPHQMPSQSIL